MDKILLKLFKKYFIFKIQGEWKDELKEIDEVKLKKWMDDELLLKIDISSKEVLEKLKEELTDKWEYILWYEINNFIADCKEDKEKEDEWNADDGLLMICPDGDESCGDCDHYQSHVHGESCDTGCGFVPERVKCIKYEKEEEEHALSLDDGKTMLVCLESDESCIECTHHIPHLYDPGCDTGCGHTTNHEKCEIYKPKDESLEEEVKQTGGV